MTKPWQRSSTSQIIDSIPTRREHQAPPAQDWKQTALTILQKIFAVLGVLTIVALATHTERQNREQLPSIFEADGTMPELRM